MWQNVGGSVAGLSGRIQQSTSPSGLQRQCAAITAPVAAHLQDRDRQAAAREVKAKNHLMQVVTALIALLRSHLTDWSNVEQALSTLDVLCSFAAWAGTSPGPTCRPTFLPEGVPFRAQHAAASSCAPCFATERRPSLQGVP